MQHAAARDAGHQGLFDGEGQLVAVDPDPVQGAVASGAGPGQGDVPPGRLAQGRGVPGLLRLAGQPPGAAVHGHGGGGVDMGAPAGRQLEGPGGTCAGLGGQDRPGEQGAGLQGAVVEQAGVDRQRSGGLARPFELTGGQAGQDRRHAPGGEVALARARGRAVGEPAQGLGQERQGGFTFAAQVEHGPGQLELQHGGAVREGRCAGGGGVAGPGHHPDGVEHHHPVVGAGVAQEQGLHAPEEPPMQHPEHRKLYAIGVGKQPLEQRCPASSVGQLEGAADRGQLRNAQQGQPLGGRDLAVEQALGLEGEEAVAFGIGEAVGAEVVAHPVQQAGVEVAGGGLELEVALDHRPFSIGEQPAVLHQGGGDDAMKHRAGGVGIVEGHSRCIARDRDDSCPAPPWQPSTSSLIISATIPAAIDHLPLHPAACRGTSPENRRSAVPGLQAQPARASM